MSDAPSSFPLPRALARFIFAKELEIGSTTGATVEADVQEDAAASMRPPPAPTPAKEDVSRVWTDMKSWGTVRPSPPGGADIKMYMQERNWPHSDKPASDKNLTKIRTTT